MRILVVVPPSEAALEQAQQMAGLFMGHEIEVASTAQEQNRRLPEADILMSNAFVPVTAGNLAQAKNLRFIQVLGVGVNHIDLDAAKAQGVVVADVAGANSVSVAEHVIMSLLCLYRPIVASHTAIQNGQWPLSQWFNQAEDLTGKTIGIVGMGRIGRELARRLLPFAVGIVYTDVVRLTEAEEAELGVSYVEKSDLLSISDAVTLHLPFTEETYHFINSDALALMQPGSVLINAARSELVDEGALVEALHSHLRGAALDVFSPEPPNPDNPLFSLPNVLLTPHGAGTTRQAQEQIAARALQNVLRFMDGRSLEDVVVDA
ncbi:2-hydroxyacid dehydrogenase [Alicyclobacillus sp. SO9]|uniref:2-hydroxyacid dehydrogenase n=1 Tax=Alicyclobacillus sp. SO9 TaxID=2665646 RepID=UPI0018E77E0D|nr:2-hydroxyacid dehydrogenase [Alicyclobacillus sp. SO9]QQE80567.1 2-hydroxyacid dehydrogenase [Alicyclobacillus sp. SO9]